MIGGWPVAGGPIAAIADEFDESTTSPLPIFLRDPDSEFVYLLIAAPLNVAPSGSASLFPYAVGEEAIGGLAADDVITEAPERVYLGNRPYRTLSSDIPPEVPFEPRLSTPYSFETHIPRPGTKFGLGDAAVGTIIALNGDRELDRFLEWSWEHREIQLLVGGVANRGRWNEEVLPLSEYWPLQLQCAGVTSDGAGIFQIIVKDASLRVAERMRRAVYGGAGGLDGDSNLAGKKKPICLGIVRNGEAVPVDPAALVYQVHDGSIEAVLSVRDKGAALTADGDISGLGLASVYDWVDVPGHFVTDLSRGIFRLGAKPQGGRVTFDAKGENAGGYIESTPDIVQHLAVGYGGFPLEKIDQRSFFNFGAVGPIGYYTGLTDPPVLEVIGKLLAGADGWANFTRDGLLTIGEHVAPENEIAVDSVSSDSVFSASSDPAGDPIWRISVGYRKSWVVQTGDDLAASVSEADRALYGAEYRVAAVTNLVAKGSFKDAADISLSSYFDIEADAQTIAESVIARHGRRRRLHNARIEDWIFQRAPGDVIHIEADRAGLQSGKNVVVLSVAEDAPDKAVDLELWG